MTERLGIYQRHQALPGSLLCFDLTGEHQQVHHHHHHLARLAGQVRLGLSQGRLRPGPLVRHLPRLAGTLVWLAWLVWEHSGPGQSQVT